MSTSGGRALADLRDARTSAGAPSARNLIVTVFGDALLPHGSGTEVSVRSLAELLESFGVSERLVRTSLTRLVNDGLLAVRSEGRRSFYRVAPDALDLFRAADTRIYRGSVDPWDGSWTLVVVDAGEATADRRAHLRQELVWAGFGVVAPNVLASPVVPASVAADIVERVGGLHQVLVSRSQVVERAGTLGGDELARRCLAVDASAERYGAFIERFERFDAVDLAALTDAEAFKLRVLAVAEFRRLVLTEPEIPPELLPDDWSGAAARSVAAKIYRALAAASESFLAAQLEPGAADDRSGALADRFGSEPERHPRGLVGSARSTEEETWPTPITERPSPWRRPRRGARSSTHGRPSTPTTSPTRTRSHVS